MKNTQESWEETPAFLQENWEEIFEFRWGEFLHDNEVLQSMIVFIKQTLQEQKYRIVEKIEKYKVEEVNSDFDFEHNITCDDIIKLIKEDK